MMDAEQLHRDALVIDSHNDSIVSQIRRGNVSITGGDSAHLARLSRAYSHETWSAYGLLEHNLDP